MTHDSSPPPSSSVETSELDQLHRVTRRHADRPELLTNLQIAVAHRPQLQRLLPARSRASQRGLGFFG